MRPPLGGFVLETQPSYDFGAIIETATPPRPAGLVRAWTTHPPSVARPRVLGDKEKYLEPLKQTEKALEKMRMPFLDSGEAAISRGSRYKRWHHRAW